jgi:hypothetical protein
VYFKPKYTAAIKTSPAIIEPELNGKPTVLIKKISQTLNSLRMLGSNNLNITNRIAT